MSIRYNTGHRQCSSYQGDGRIFPHCSCGSQYMVSKSRRFRRLSVVPHCFFLSSTTGHRYVAWCQFGLL